MRPGLEKEKRDNLADCERVTSEASPPEQEDKAPPRGRETSLVRRHKSQGWHSSADGTSTFAKTTSSRNNRNHSAEKRTPTVWFEAEVQVQMQMSGDNLAKDFPRPFKSPLLPSTRIIFNH
ncbi:hypothetical protein MLD38_016157 [Melastoma candidum]|uniref:Uncharacterized protein n=1 Tax=Melastoma candidum TaxID=119954 RepID=A0ACB9RI34_9MYRT|nr:hypothetical protein MLD38_016157 [Melastoma candidum]